MLLCSPGPLQNVTRSNAGGSTVSTTDTWGKRLQIKQVRGVLKAPSLCARDAQDRLRGVPGRDRTTTPSCPLLSRTLVPSGYTDNCSTNAFMISRETPCVPSSGQFAHGFVRQQSSPIGTWTHQGIKDVHQADLCQLV